MNAKTVISKYAHFMRQIRRRTSVIARCIHHNQRGRSVTGYRETDIDLCYLQLRKCLELIMFSSVIAHNAFGLELSKHLRDKEYNASQIVKKIRSLNPNYYPVPVRDVNPENGIRKVDKINAGYLTEADLCELYDRVCGKLLHANREDLYSDRIDEHFAEITKYHSKLIKLLNHHWVHVSDKIALAVLMKTESSGDVQVTHMEALPG